jgi:hypothetical protein
MSISLHDRAIPRNQNFAPAVALREVRKVHGQGDAAVVALDGVSVGLSQPAPAAMFPRVTPGECRVCSLRVMAEDAAGRLDLAKLPVAVENAPPVAAAEVVGEWLEAALGAFDVSFLVVDFSGRALIRLGHAGLRAAVRTQGRETAERVPLDGSAHGRALRDQAVDVELRAGEARLIAPVTNRGEAIGVLELTLPEPPDEQTLADVALAAHALAYVIIANRRFTDLFEWNQRSVRLSLAAEIQHRLLPGAFTCEGGSSRWQLGSSPQGRSPETVLTSRWSETRCICR